MECNRFMSRRDIVVNTLLGTFLLLVFFACLAAIGLVVLFGFVRLEWIVRLVVPDMTLPRGFSIIGIWMLLSLWNGIRHVREKRWGNAFLCFACAPLVGLGLFTPVHTGQALFFWVPVMVVFSIANDATLGRLKFFLAAAIAGGAVLLNSGLLRNGTLSQTIANCLLAMVAVWWIAVIRDNWRTEAPNQPLALPPAGA